MQDYKKDFSYRVLISAGGDSIKSKQAEAYKEGFFSKTPIINCPQLSYLWGIEINIKILLSFFRVPISRIAKYKENSAEIKNLATCVHNTQRKGKGLLFSTEAVERFLTPDL